jgi:hypothetical protein
MRKQILAALIFLLAVSIQPIRLQAQTTPCCNDVTCHTNATKLATNMSKSVEFLGVYPANQPVSYEGKKKFLDSLKKCRPSNYNAIKKAAKQINDWSAKDPSRNICMSIEYGNLPEDRLLWINYFITTFYVSVSSSPEFRKGFGMLLHTGIGASSLFTSGERFASLSGLMLSYTFAPAGKTAGGRVRALIGPGYYYSATKNYLLVHPRLEFRIIDIGSELTNIGCLKLIAQGGFQKKIQLGGLGFAVEISRFHIQVTGNYDFKQSVFVLQSGLGYSFLFTRKTKRHQPQTNSICLNEH